MLGVSRSRRSAFSLVEMMVVVSIIAIMTAIAVPKFTEVQRKSKESALKTDLQIYRSAIYVYFSDTGLYPTSLNDLAATAAPSQGINSNGATRNINSETWRGPYIQQVRPDPVSNNPLKYSVAAGTVGQVKPSATGNDSTGTPFADY